MCLRSWQAACFAIGVNKSVPSHFYNVLLSTLSQSLCCRQHTPRYWRLVLLRLPVCMCTLHHAYRCKHAWLLTSTIQTCDPFLLSVCCVLQSCRLHQGLKRIKADQQLLYNLCSTCSLTPVCERQTHRFCLCIRLNRYPGYTVLLL